MSLQSTLAFLTLPSMLIAAYWALRRELLRTALSLVVATPVAIACVYVLAGHISLPTSKALVVAAETTAAAPADQHANASAPASSKVTELRTQAEEARRGKNYSQAAALFREITQVAPFDPDGWADLGDAQAAASGGDLGAGQTSIDRALELDPEHAKALWLKASSELQAKRFGPAADLWRRLLKILPAGSSDAKIVQTNLEEAERLASGKGAAR